MCTVGSGWRPEASCPRSAGLSARGRRRHRPRPRRRHRPRRLRCRCRLRSRRLRQRRPEAYGVSRPPRAAAAARPCRSRLSAARWRPAESQVRPAPRLDRRRERSGRPARGDGRRGRGETGRAGVRGDDAERHQPERGSGGRDNETPTGHEHSQDGSIRGRAARGPATGELCTVSSRNTNFRPASRIRPVGVTRPCPPLVGPRCARRYVGNRRSLDLDAGRESPGQGSAERTDRMRHVATPTADSPSWTHPRCLRVRRDVPNLRHTVMATLARACSASRYRIASGTSLSG